MSMTRVVEEMVLAALVSDKMMAPRKLRTDMALTLLSVLLAGTGVFYVAAALDRYLGDMYRPDVAALAAGGLAFLAAGLSASVAWRSHKQRRLSLTTARAEIGRNVRGLIEEVCRELDDPVRENPKTAMALAAVAGFFAATKH